MVITLGQPLVNIMVSASEEFDCILPLQYTLAIVFGPSMKTAGDA